MSKHYRVEFKHWGERVPLYASRPVVESVIDTETNLEVGELVRWDWQKPEEMVASGQWTRFQSEPDDAMKVAK